MMSQSAQEAEHTPVVSSDEVSTSEDLTTVEDLSTVEDLTTSEDLSTVEDPEPELSVAMELRFTAPVLGLEHLSRFALVTLHEESSLFSLQSLEDAAVRLLVMAPSAVFEDYDPPFDAVSRAAVGLLGDAAGLMLVVVNAGASLAESTVNLLAPILVNPESGDAAQVVLTGTEYPLRYPLAA